MANRVRRRNGDVGLRIGESYLLRRRLRAGSREVVTNRRPELSCAVDERRARALFLLPYHMACCHGFLEE
jgi:hypothetical protein